MNVEELDDWHFMFVYSLEISRPNVFYEWIIKISNGIVRLQYKLKPHKTVLGCIYGAHNIVHQLSHKISISYLSNLHETGVLQQYKI